VVFESFSIKEESGWDARRYKFKRMASWDLVDFKSFTTPSRIVMAAASTLSCPVTDRLSLNFWLWRRAVSSFWDATAERIGRREHEDNFMLKNNEANKISST